MPKGNRTQRDKAVVNDYLQVLYFIEEDDEEEETVQGYLLLRCTLCLQSEEHLSCPCCLYCYLALARDVAFCLFLAYAMGSHALFIFFQLRKQNKSEQNKIK